MKINDLSLFNIIIFQYYFVDYFDVFNDKGFKMVINNLFIVYSQFVYFFVNFVYVFFCNCYILYVLFFIYYIVYYIILNNKI